MKKYIILLALLSIMACSKNENLVADLTTNIIELTAISSDTKTHLEANKVIWDSGDEINVFSLGNGGQYVSNKFVTSETGSTVVFKGEGVELNDQVYAIYPYNEGNGFTSEKVFTTTISTIEQTVVKDSYPTNANIAVGQCNNNKEVAFKNLGSLLKFKVTQEGADTLRRLEIKANGGENLAIVGAIQVDFNGGNPKFTPSIDATTSNIINVLPNSAFVVGDTYYVWVNPGNYASGISITLISPTQMYATKVGTGALSIERNQIVDLGDIGGMVLKEKEVEKLTISFDFTGVAMEGWPTTDNWKKATPEEPAVPGDTTVVYVHPDGKNYKFFLTDAGNAIAARVFWSTDGRGVVLGATWRYFGFPAIENHKLISLACEQGTNSSASGRMAGISSNVVASNVDETNIFVKGGDPIYWTVKGDTYSYYLEDTEVNTMYYLTCTKGGIGVAKLTLVYEKIE